MENSTALSGNFHDLLPPRKRLLLGLKHATASPADTIAIHTPPPESLRIEVHVDAANAAPPPPHSLLLCSPSQKCFTCADGGVLLHRVPYLAGSVGYHCSLCILEMNKKMYCAFCYEVIEKDLPSFSSSRFLACCRCERLTHFDCALKSCLSLEEGDVYLCKECHPRSNGKFTDAEITVQEGVQQCKRPLVSAGMFKLPLLDIKELVAARIVAITAKRAALRTKQKAELLAKTAAHAAAHAKNVLDYMSNLSQMDLEDTSLNGKHKGDVGNVPHRTPKCSKKRALSSIVASEISSKREGTVVNDMITPKYNENKLVGFNAHSDSAETVSPCDVQKKPGPSVTHKARLPTKRMKSLSLLGLQNSNSISAPLKSSNAASKKMQKSGFLSKGNLGAIMSHFLASKKLSMRTMKEPFWKTKGGNSYGATLGVSSENGIKEKVHSMTVLALENGRSSDNSYSS